MIERLSLAFDLEGTMVNLEDMHQLAFETVASRFEVRFGREEFRAFVGVGDEAISNEIVRLCRIVGRNVDFPQIRRMKKSVYRDILYSHEITPREGAADYLDKARMFSATMVVASLTPEKDALNILRRSGLSQFFSYSLNEKDVRRLKPDPEIYLKAADLLQVQPRIMLVHEDSPPGVVAAKIAGSPVAAFPVHDNLQFNPQPDAIFLSWVGLDPKQIYNSLVKAPTSES